MSFGTRLALTTTMMTTNETFRIRDDVVPVLMKRLEKIEKKARKLGSLPIEVREVGTEVEDDGDGTPILFRLFEVTGSAPKAGGWSFLGTLDHTVESGVILRSVPGVSLNERYGEAEPVCDHCGFERRRRETFVVHKEETGEYKQVGRKCAKDFLGGGTDPTEVARMLQYLYEIKSIVETATSWSAGTFGGHAGLAAYLRRYLTVTAAVIERDGWRSRRKAYEEGGATTSSTVNRLVFTKRENLSKDDLEFLATLNAEHEAKAEAAIEWASSLRDKEGISDYEHNVCVVAEGNVVTMKLSGVAASIVAVHQMRLERERREAVEESMRKNSVGLGAPGDRGEYTVNVLGIRECESDWGVSFLVKMVTDTGCACAFFTKHKPDMKPGGVYRIKGTVKEIDEYRGIVETRLIRCTVV